VPGPGRGGRRPGTPLTADEIDVRLRLVADVAVEPRRGERRSSSHSGRVFRWILCVGPRLGRNDTWGVAADGAHVDDGETM
jgi:hypothetical protein